MAAFVSWPELSNQVPSTRPSFPQAKGGTCSCYGVAMLARRWVWLVMCVAVTGSVAAAPPPALTREALREMFRKRDPYCGTRDPWANFASRTKTADEVATLQAWADDRTEPVEARRPALQALCQQHDPKLVAWWREKLAAAGQDTPERMLALDGLLSADAASTLAEVFAHLGETEAIDSFLILSATNEHLTAAVPFLRGYQRSKKASPKMQAELTRRLLSLDPAGAEADADALLADGDDASLWTVVNGETKFSVARLEQLLPRLERPSDALQGELADRIAFELFHLLERRDPAAAQLATIWSNPPEATAKLLDRAPAISLVLALWQQSRGDFSSGLRLFTQGLARPPEPPTEDGSYDMSTPQVAYAGLMLHHACTLEMTGQRTAALTQLKAFETWSMPVRHEVANLLDNLQFRAWSPYWCYRAISSETLAAMPLVLTATRTRTKKGYRLVVEARNASSQAVKVRGCPVSGGGFLPGDHLWVTADGHQLDAPRLGCQPQPRTLEAGAVMSARFDVAASGNGPLRLTLRPGVEMRGKPDELWFVFAD